MYYHLLYKILERVRKKEKDRKIIHYNNLLGTGDGEGVVIVASTKEYWKNSNNINVHIIDINQSL